MAELVVRDDRDAYAAANVEFHTLIYLGAHNDILGEFARGCGGASRLSGAPSSEPRAGRRGRTWSTRPS
jgi:DNA-binding FadR family transcriptional regulator